MRGMMVIYATWHPLDPSPPTFQTLLTCHLIGHAFSFTDVYWPHADLLCTRCSLYTSVQYLRISKPPVTLPEQQRVIEH